MGDEPRNPSDSLPESELHAASDHNRIVFLQTELASSFTFAEMAAFQQQAGETDHAAESLAHAETGYATLVRYLADPKHSKHITREQGLELQAGVERLRVKLNKLKSR